MKIGNKLRKLRIETSYSVEYVAAKLDISVSTYRKCETDKKSPELNLLEKMAKLYDKDVLEFLYEIIGTRKKHHQNEHLLEIKELMREIKGMK